MTDLDEDGTKKSTGSRGKRASGEGQGSPVRLRLACVFYRTESGREPVRDWLKEEVPAGARKVIGADIQTVQATWPIDKPLVDSLGGGLREVRSTHDKIEYRTFFTIDGAMMVLLHGAKKTTKKTLKQDLALARKRKTTLERNR